MASEPKRPRKSDDGKSDDGQILYGKSYERVTKEDLFMIIALWMQDFVKEAPESENKQVGAVLVLPNDVIYAVDCSRDGVHAVQRLLMKHYDKAKGCKMFMSRKPCPMCAKLLVQAKVERVLFLPFEPEYYPSAAKVSKRNQVDNMFTASAIAQTRYVLHVTKAIIGDAKKKTPAKNEEEYSDIQKEKRELDGKYGFQKNPNWKASIKEQLPWPAFDPEIDAQVQVFFENTMEWMARVRVLFGCGLKYNFEVAKTQGYDDDDENPEITFEGVPDQNKPDILMKAHHFITIARYLSQRTDDPKAGVGAVIVSPKMEILALGWNGFPLKALYGEFPRDAGSDGSPDKKAPYIIHADQNALLMRNQKNIEGSTLFVSGRPPCNECAPLIAMQGVKTVVLDTDQDNDVNRIMQKKDEYKMFSLFPKMVKKGKFVCYRTVKTNSQ